MNRSHFSLILRRKRKLHAEAEGQSEYLLEMRFVPMPPDTHARVVLRAKDLLYFQSRSPVGFYSARSHSSAFPTLSCLDIPGARRLQLQWP